MLLFQNKGEIDPRSLTSFGVSSKENAGAIGFFGTGLKYAIAILLRNNCPITIYSGNKVYEFGTKTQKIRVDEFEFVTMNRRRANFTTELGKTWEPWQAFREIYCNCKDEGGEARLLKAGETVEPEKGYTKVLVGGSLMVDIWHDRSSVILETEPLAKDNACEVHPGESHYLYYRGVRAYKLHLPTTYTYNILRKIDLTEDRTIKYTFESDSAIRSVLVEAAPANMVKDVVTAPKHKYEHDFNFNGCLPSDDFTSVVKKLYREFDPRLNDTAAALCRNLILGALTEEHAVELESVEELRLKKAVDFCKNIGYPVDEYPIVVTDWLGEEVLGRAHEGKIYLSKRVFMMGTKMVAGTLIEEYIHLKFKVYDCTRQMQNLLMDAIVSIGERVTGEPL